MFFNRRNPQDDKTKQYTIIVGFDGTATIECPKCGVIKSSAVSSFKGKSNHIAVLCRCGHQFPVTLDFRKAGRLPVNFTGFYAKMDGQSGWGYMKVTDLSLGGMGVQLIGKHEVVAGDELRVEFTLDDFPASVIRKRVVVIRIDKGHLNCKFVDTPDVSDPLVTYLLTW